MQKYDAINKLLENFYRSNSSSVDRNVAQFSDSDAGLINFIATEQI